MRYIKVILLLVIWSLTGLQVQSQTLYETGSIYPVDETTGILPIKVITQDDIRMLNASSLMDIITYLLSFEAIYVGRKGYDTRFNSWGKNNIKLLINGRAVLPDALDKFSYSQIPVYNIERIEIMEGSFPVLYASNAVSVIINVIMKKNSKDLIHAEAGVRYSTKGNTDVFGIVDFKTSKHRLGLGMNRNFFAGYDPDNHVRFRQWKPHRLMNFTAEYNYSIIHGLDFYTSVFTTNDLVRDWGIPVPNTNRVTDNKMLTKHTILNGGLKGKLSKYHYLMFDNSYTAVSQQNTVYTRLLDQELEEGSSSAPGDSISYDQYKVIFMLARSLKNKVSYEMGMEFNHQRDRNVLIQDAIKTRITNMAFNGRVAYLPSRKFGINAGLRFNESSKYTTPLSYEASFKYFMSDEVSIRGNYSRSFRTPTFNELYYVFEDESLNIKGNLNLQSEIYEGFLGSINLEFGKLNINASGYFQKTNNGILFRLTDPQEQVYSFVNLRNIKTQGAKLSVVYNNKYIKQIAAVNNIGINPFSEVNAYSSFVELVSRTTYTNPKTGFQVWFFNKYRTDKTEFVLANDSLEELQTQSYWLSDIGASIPLLSKKLVFSAGMKNIFNIYSVEGLHLPLVRLNDDEINRKVPVAFDFGRRIWFSLQYKL